MFLANLVIKNNEIDQKKTHIKWANKDSANIDVEKKGNDESNINIYTVFLLTNSDKTRLTKKMERSQINIQLIMYNLALLIK